MSSPSSEGDCEAGRQRRDVPSLSTYKTCIGVVMALKAAAGHLIDRSQPTSSKYAINMMCIPGRANLEPWA
jgi:hypothetical protein